jgi:hypothetical protein
MASIAARITVLCDRPDPRLRTAAILLGGTIFGLAVAAAAAIAGCYALGMIEWFLLLMGNQVK